MTACTVDTNKTLSFDLNSYSGILVSEFVNVSYVFVTVKASAANAFANSESLFKPTAPSPNNEGVSR